MSPVLPFQVDPLSWTFGLPFTLALVCLYYQPRSNRVKVFFAELARMDAQVWSRLFFSHIDYCEERAHRKTQIMISCVAVALGAASLLSFFVFLGWLHTP